ncbi:MAG: cell wall-active antibiotics response protein, partial [Acidimicrobiia bacterium]|nr:cell wall-active antibiotics response protein [Acidimicrobiia bacterium]
VLIDLSSAYLREDCTVKVYSIFGDVTVILPDGVRASLQSTTIFGDRKELLHQAIPGAPYVRVVAATLFGNAKLFSLSLVPEGPFRRLWRALRGN